MNFRLGWTNEHFQSPRVESKLDRKRLVPSRSRIGRADRYTKRICSLGFVRGGFRKCRWRLAALHRQHCRKYLLRERGELIFSNARTIEDDTAAIPCVARTGGFVWSFVTAVRLDGTERGQVNGQVETDETENGNGKLKQKVETEKLKFGNGRHNCSKSYLLRMH